MKVQLGFSHGSGPALSVQQSVVSVRSRQLRAVSCWMPIAGCFWRWPRTA